MAGDTYVWSGNRRAGRGRMHIGRDDTVFTIVPTDSGIRVTWWMSGAQTLTAGLRAWTRPTRGRG